MKKNIHYFIAITPFLFFIFGYIFSYFLIRTTVYQAPNLIGLKLPQALALAAQNHATIKLLHEQECPGIEAETIIAQKPRAGRLIKPNQTILITIAKEAAPILAPDLKLKKLASCEKSCKECNLKLKHFPIIYPLPEETCIGQIPQAGESVPNKKIVIYTAQEKPNIYIMPNLINKNLNEIIEMLTKQEIAYTVFSEYKKIDAPYNDTFVVTNQKPKPGSLIHINKSLNIQLEVA